MEASEIQIITQNEPELLTLTKCSPLFLAYFSKHGILNSDEIRRITKLGNQDDILQAREFYDIIKTRTGSFQILRKSLEATQQTGARKLLESVKNLDSSSEKHHTSRFLKPPLYLKSFLEAAGPSEIIVISPETKLTCERIHEPVSKKFPCHLCPYSEFIDFLPDVYSTNEEKTPVIVVNCENEGCFLHEAGDITARVILVVPPNFPNAQGTTQVVKEKILWIELSPSFRRKIVNVVQEMTSLPPDASAKALSSIESDLLLELVQGRKPPILSETIPVQLPYYIPRYLVTRDVISNEIFTVNKTDLNLIEGIQRHELTDLVSFEDNPKLTDTSSYLISNFPVAEIKFAVLEHSSHYDHLVELYKTSELEEYKSMSIHHLEYKSEVLIWKQSHGKINTVQQCIKSEQTDISEDLLLAQISRGESKRKLICISDTPGMGKSILLENIANSLKCAGCHGNIAFVVINELIQQIKLSEAISESSRETDIKNSLSNYICENELGKLALTHKPSVLHHLLLDAFDEVPIEDVELGFQCLLTLQKLFPSTYLWVTTRPHMLVQMEQTLGILGHNIKPFNDLNQLSFLTKYWLQKNNLEHRYIPRLEGFGKKCVTSLKSRINIDEEDFAGVPLQCLLIGEVFASKANECANSDTPVELHWENTQITSLLGLYEKLVEIKIDKFSQHYPKPTDSRDIELAHTYHAIGLLFPNDLPSLMGYILDLRFENLTQDIFNAGIMESKRTKYEFKPRFIHRTFAEYFVAKYIFVRLHERDRNNFWDFVYYSVLTTVPFNHKFQNLTVPSKVFKHSVICYFLESMLKNTNSSFTETQQSIPAIPIQPDYSLSGSIMTLYPLKSKFKNTIIGIRKPKANAAEQIKSISIACAHSNSFKLFNNFVLPSTRDNPVTASLVFNTNLVILATIRADREILGTACEVYKGSTGTELFDINIDKKNLLDLSVMRGNYSVMEYLLTVEGFKKRTTKIICSELILKCLSSSYNDDPSVIADKINILRKFSDEVQLCAKTVLHFQVMFTKYAKDVHCQLLQEIHNTRLVNLDTVLGYLKINVKTYNCEQIRRVRSPAVSPGSQSEGKLYMLTMLTNTYSYIKQFVFQLVFN